MIARKLFAFYVTVKSRGSLLKLSLGNLPQQSALFSIRTWVTCAGGM